MLVCAGVERGQEVLRTCGAGPEPAAFQAVLSTELRRVCAASGDSWRALLSPPAAAAIPVGDSAEFWDACCAVATTALLGRFRPSVVDALGKLAVSWVQG
jgi:hypothetical protein